MYPNKELITTSTTSQRKCNILAITRSLGLMWLPQQRMHFGYLRKTKKEESDQSIDQWTGREKNEGKIRQRRDTTGTSKVGSNQSCSYQQRHIGKLKHLYERAIQERKILVKVIERTGKTEPKSQLQSQTLSEKITVEKNDCSFCTTSTKCFGRLQKQFRLSRLNPENRVNDRAEWNSNRVPRNDVK